MHFRGDADSMDGIGVRALVRSGRDWVVWWSCCCCWLHNSFFGTSSWGVSGIEESLSLLALVWAFPDEA